ncbi:F420-dependent oxidoreductase-like protein [Nocardioides luteus]|uniref:LLM class F420-dependent oxidoreductase n=1 Tax=Nocardioides luteus TaxID=1844 RepID=A0ABQ5SXB9_9ACTN|nr:LLM class F420-dependent oxidoreductase [Nocardioides luteus]MDR7312219.1 F420-dependent oxidoreductase-like protein [Nocardioides luteus]GGR56783.1 LLM class F420-dependent oxidoreductase [Nocardioides luteus]GLJ68466.1 LLM class F420-dependent oxidoreductase [Nocardioides luteus]
MKFGFFVPQGWRFDLVGIDPADQWTTMKDLATHADSGPWESIWVYDHFHTTPEPSDQATHEAWSLMAGLGAVTSRVRLGQMCSCMSYRNPAYLAKVAATADHISGGRIEMGIGAGWYEHEWRAYGYGFPAARDRLGMLREGVQIFQQAWTKGVSSLDGKYYQVDGAICQPLPLQQGRSGIPLWIAGGGEKVTLKIAAQYADYTNFAGDPETFKTKSDILAAHCENLGRDFGEITRSSNYNVFIGENEAEVERKMSEAAARLTPHLGEAKVAEMSEGWRSAGLNGTPEQIVEALKEREALGMTYAITYFADAAYDRSSIELFESKVIPELA